MESCAFCGFGSYPDGINVACTRCGAARKGGAWSKGGECPVCAGKGHEMIMDPDSQKVERRDCATCGGTKVIEADYRRGDKVFRRRDMNFNAGIVVMLTSKRTPKGEMVRAVRVKWRVHGRTIHSSVRVSDLVPATAAEQARRLDAFRRQQTMTHCPACRKLFDSARPDLERCPRCGAELPAEYVEWSRAVLEKAARSRPSEKALRG